jgi:hypothetical protein
LAWLLPSRQDTIRVARPYGCFKAESDSARKSGGGARTKILYFNPESVHAKYVDIIRQQAHDVTTASSRTPRTRIDAQTNL